VTSIVTAAAIRLPIPEEIRMSRLVHLAAAVAAAFSAGAAAQGGAPNDAQIAGIVVAANQVDIDAGKVAEQRASNADVRAFGQRMVTDHTAVNRQAVDLANKLKLKPEDSDTAQSLKKGGADNVASLKNLSGTAFDKAYVEHEVAYHEAVIGALDKTLVPNAKNAELKSLLEKARPAFVAHLDHAKQIQAKLGK
jgi:putative membrane protein